MSLGQIFNTAANITGALHGSRKSEKTLKDFLYSVTKYGVQLKSAYEVEYTGMGGITFFVQAVNVPGIKMNTGTISYKGRQITLPVNSEQDHNLQMTVLNDGTGFIYNQMRRILEIDSNNGLLESTNKMTFRALGDGQNTAGATIDLHGVVVTSVSGLDFGSSDSGISTFTVDCYVSRAELKWSQVKSKTGLLGGLDKVTSTVSNILG